MTTNHGARRGPTLRELTVQALSSVERGYDLLAPKFDATPFRTPERILDETVSALRPLGPFRAGLDICCGTGAGVRVLDQVCRERVVGVDFSAGMLDVAREAVGAAESKVQWVRADVRALPFAPAFDLAVSFGAFGHFLPKERPGLFAQVHSVLRPGGVFAFPIGAPPRPGSWPYWAMLGFDAAMRVRNAVWWPRFVMYYRTFPLAEVWRELERAGFEVELRAMSGLGRRPDGTPRAALVVARSDPEG
ncbi:class I SAM-dependent methyltransferase [Streptomyces sp. FIT100]|uniref:class I SAM-dependent methyltransferase n=1 Tax=Streptomyces sp. FIT100 TaxID=2837956 RepID=UPI0021C91A83|nr:class I SAM-dependent methyltransferase [Streptomyces sp. FIT100]UUN30120.1 methyltransferase domain-containing protein [Streptomyces sp. FIT100]